MNENKPSPEPQQPDDGALPEVWCVIPHFGPDAVLERCLESLAKVDYPEELFGRDRILVLNNNPPNENLLFTASINAGIREAHKRRRQHAAAERCVIWLLNNDTVVEPGCIRGAIGCFTEMGWNQTGIVASKNLRLDNPDEIFWGGSEQCFPAGKHKFGLVSKGELNERTKEEWVTFSCAFVNDALVESIGLLDRNMRHVASDSDYCFRARAQGWECYYEPASVIRHAVGTSHRGAPPELENIFTQDVQYFFYKWINAGVFNSLTRYPIHVSPPTDQA